MDWYIVTEYDGTLKAVSVPEGSDPENIDGWLASNKKFSNQEAADDAILRRGPPINIEF